MPAVFGGGGSAVIRSNRFGVVSRKKRPSSMCACTRESRNGFVEPGQTIDPSSRIDFEMSTTSTDSNCLAWARRFAVTPTP